MRIRILKSVVTIHGAFQAGDVAEIPDSMAQDWVRAEIAMEDKSLDGGNESKSKRMPREKAVTTAPPPLRYPYRKGKNES